MFNINAFKEFVFINFNNNYSRCAEAIGVNVSTISRILNNETGPGVRFMSQFSDYCKKNNIDLNKYFF
jgi:transcriptional regulator with XRE-family HTH domain